jgi:uncharacterized protein (TIGR04222 family)
MDADLEHLWNAIQSYPLDDPGAVDSFSTRLARENRWTAAYTGRVVHEYRRFVLLAVSAGHSVTPSDAVDQAWHLHLTYSEAYWGHFCPEVLGRPLHHGPSRGGREEQSKYRGAYELTLDSYRRVFGEPPPADIWPPVAQRFAGPPRWMRVNGAEHWVLPRPSYWLRRAWHSTGGQRSTALPLAPLPKLAPCEIAYLSGGARLAVDTSLARLVAAGHLAADHSKARLVAAVALDDNASGLERALYQYTARAGGMGTSRLRAEGLALAQPVGRRLAEQGWYQLDRSRLPFALAVLSLLLAGAPLWLAETLGQTPGWPWLLCGTAVLAALVGFRSRPGPSARGRALLASLRERYQPLVVDARSQGELSAELLAMAVALYGAAELVGSELARLAPELARTASAGAASVASAGGVSSCGGGGGCGGDGGCGGCGGGCGGCGG